MRFHCGISFSWRTIKKFLLPFILGILAILGFNFIYDKESTPLGFIKVDALENYNSYYDYNYTDLSNYENLVIDSNNHTLKEFFNTIMSRNDNQLDYVLTFRINNNTIDRIYLFVFYPITDNYYFNIFGNGSNLIFKFTYSSGNGAMYQQNGIFNGDIFSSTFYTNFISCITTSTCSRNEYFSNDYILSNGNTTINNNDNYVFSSNKMIIYYSSKDLILNNIYSTSNSSYIYKSLRVNNENVEVSSKFPTYTDYLESQNQPTPDEPTPDEPTPDEPTDNTNHEPLFNKIYWFDDNTTEIGILSSIYILLFLYCLTMIIFRILTFIKNTRW